MDNPPGALRKAKIQDVEPMHALLYEPGQRGEIIQRSRADLYASLRDFFVWISPQGRLVGVGGLHITWEDLAEVRSLVVAEEFRGRGIGRRLVDACLDEAVMLGLRRVFVLTYRPDFFGRLGFKEVDKSALPHKVWFDCVHCVKFPECDEVAMIYEVEA